MPESVGIRMRNSRGDIDFRISQGYFDRKTGFQRALGIGKLREMLRFSQYETRVGGESGQQSRKVFRF